MPARPHPAVAPPRKLRRVAVMTSASGSLDRGILRGINRYAMASRRWHLRTCIADYRSLETVAAWGPDGIIASATSWPFIKKLQALKVPVVNMSGRVANQPFPQVTCDYQATGRLAAEYFLDKGYRNFGAMIQPENDFSIQRFDGFSNRLAEAGFGVVPCEIRAQEGIIGHWERCEVPLSRWLRSLPKPAAILGGTDRAAILINQMCMQLNIPVPEQVAILGTDDDDVVCNQGYPPLSSIRQPAEQLGEEAAKMLDGLMSGGKPPAKPVRLPPLGVVTRASTDIMAIEDEEVAMAVRYIAQRACEGLRVGDLIKELPVSRRVLERRFRKALGRSLLDEIHRVRVEHAKFLLATGTLSMPAVARQAGFDSAHRMWAVFRRVAKVSPADYRKRLRA